MLSLPPNLTFLLTYCRMSFHAPSPQGHQCPPLHQILMPPPRCLPYLVLSSFGEFPLLLGELSPMPSMMSYSSTSPSGLFYVPSPPLWPLTTVVAPGSSPSHPRGLKDDATSEFRPSKSFPKLLMRSLQQAKSNSVPKKSS